MNDCEYINPLTILSNDSNDIRSLSDDEFKHILMCKNINCFFCKNILKEYFCMDMIMKGSIWTPELIENVKRFRNDGLTYEEIGKCIGKSKMAVYAKLHPYYKKTKANKSMMKGDA